MLLGGLRPTERVSVKRVPEEQLCLPCAPASAWTSGIFEVSNVERIQHQIQGRQSIEGQGGEDFARDGGDHGVRGVVPRDHEREPGRARVAQGRKRDIYGVGQWPNGRSGAHRLDPEAEENAAREVARVMREGPREGSAVRRSRAETTPVKGRPVPGLLAGSTKPKRGPHGSKPVSHDANGQRTCGRNGCQSPAQPPTAPGKPWRRCVGCMRERMAKLARKSHAKETATAAE